MQTSRKIRNRNKQRKLKAERNLLFQPVPFKPVSSVPIP